jgi:NDP-sugar pyrophosphorylase family protein
MLPVAILAGGLATRLRPLTENIPKSLVEINGEPFLWHQLRLLRQNGIDRVVLCLSHLGEQVRDLLGDGREFGLHIDYSFDGPTLLGTAGALKRAQPVYPNESQWDTSNVEFVDGQILAYNKKQRTARMRHIDYGLGVLHSVALARVPDGQAFDLATLYRELLDAGQLAAFEAPHRFYEIGSFSGIEELCSYLGQGRGPA